MEQREKLALDSANDSDSKFRKLNEEFTKLKKEYDNIKNVKSILEKREKDNHEKNDFFELKSCEQSEKLNKLENDKYLK